MKNFATKTSRAAMMAVAGLAMATAADAATYTFDNLTGGRIPPTGTSGLTTSTVNVAGVTNVTDVDVTIYDVNHTWAADLDIWLTGPTGTTVDLVFDEGGASDPVNSLWTFTDGGAPFSPGFPGSGTYAPEQPLSAFNGLDPLGTWTLSINDDAGLDVGNYGGWTLTLRADSTAAVPLPATLPLAATGLGLLGALGLRRRKPRA